MTKDFTLNVCLHEQLGLETVLNLKDNDFFAQRD